MIRIWGVALLLCGLVLSACNHSGSGSGNDGSNAYTNVPPPPGGVASFTVSPLDLSLAGSVTALGHLGGGGHVEPTPHAYIYAWNLLSGNSNVTTVQNVYAPATGSVIFVLSGGAGSKITFRATENFYYYLDGVVTSSPPAVGAIVHAGDLLGQTEVGGTLDVGAFDASVTLTGFVNPARYTYDENHCVTPWEYFTEPTKSQLYSAIYRAPGAPVDVRIDQDVAGTLAGTWFEQSLPADSSVVESPTGWPKTVSFALDEYDGATPRVSVGGWPASAGNPGLPGGGVWGIPAGLASWSDITQASGFQAFPLLNEFDGRQQGLIAVQMLNATTIKVEIWPGSLASTAPFDSAALVYVR